MDSPKSPKAPTPISLGSTPFQEQKYRETLAGPLKMRLLTSHPFLLALAPLVLAAETTPGHLVPLRVYCFMWRKLRTLNAAAVSSTNSKNPIKHVSAEPPAGLRIYKEYVLYKGTYKSGSVANLT